MRGRSWRRAIALLRVWVAEFRAELSEFATIWGSGPNESHGFLVVGALPLLLWLRRGRLGAGAGLRGPATLPLAATDHVPARAAQVDLLAWVAMPLVCWAAAWVALGATAARTLAVPVALFWLASPLWANLTPLL